MLDFLQGPIWTSDPETGRPNTGIEAIDADEQIRQLNYEIQDLFCSYYEFDSHDQACWFDAERERADKDRMLGLLAQLRARLDEVNDGTFVVEDLETERVRSLQLPTRRRGTATATPTAAASRPAPRRGRDLAGRRARMETIPQAPPPPAPYSTS